MAHRVTITDIKELTHDVRQITVEKPAGYEFTPGQATDVAIDREGWRDQQRPFTFTGLGNRDSLEFVIKVYPDHDGVTEQIGTLKVGEALLIDEPWGAIRHKGAGVFIAGGAGITPFIAIIRDLRKRGDLQGHRLLFSNRIERDIILRDELEAADGLDCLFTVTHQPDSPLAAGLIDREFLRTRIDDFDQRFYVCGPPEMVDSVNAALTELGADPDGLVFEE